MPETSPAAAGGRRRPAPRRLPALVAIALSVVLVAAGAAPAPAAATDLTPATVEASILSLVNRERTERGLRPLRRDLPLAAIAGERVANLVGATSFSHAAAGGSLTPPLDGAGVQWYRWGEVLAWRAGGLATTTAAAIVGGWRRSSSHWALLMSRTFNYVGFGVAVRPSDSRVFAAGVLTESKDHTAPGARVTSATRSGTTITFAWRGYDPPLQTHWAGLRDFDVWYRVDGGTWRLIRDNTTATSLRLSSRARGHRYELMVRARDRANNRGAPSAPVGIRVP
jgi:uncharacterized protein YkwD